MYKLYIIVHNIYRDTLMSRIVALEKNFTKILTDERGCQRAFGRFFDVLLGGPIPFDAVLGQSRGDQNPELIAAMGRARGAERKHGESRVPYFQHGYGLIIAGDADGLQAFTGPENASSGDCSPTAVLAKLAIGAYAGRLSAEGEEPVQAYRHIDRILIGHGLYDPEDPMPPIGYGAVRVEDGFPLILAADDMRPTPAVQAATMNRYDALLDPADRGTIQGHEFAAYHNQVAVNVLHGVLSGSGVAAPDLPGLVSAGMNVHL
jgi:hypothetical protein